MKCQLFKEIGDMILCRKWANFLPSIYDGLHMEMRKYSKIPQTRYFLEQSLISVIQAMSMNGVPNNKSEQINLLMEQLKIETQTQVTSRREERKK